jgi:hypothetical protein
VRRPSTQGDKIAPVGSVALGEYEQLSGGNIGHPKGTFSLYQAYVILTHSTKAIDYFCLAADTNDDLPPLQKKKWSDYWLVATEWKLVKLVHHCLEVL